MTDDSPRTDHTPRILVVEDEARMRDLLVSLLHECDCQARGVASAEAALESCDADRFDAILLDLSLPGMDGMAFMRALRAREDHVPIIILSAHGTLAHAQEAIRLGVVEFLTKPCHLGEIESAVARIRRPNIDRLPELSWEDGQEAARDMETLSLASSTLANLERDAIASALRRHGGNKSAAAKELGISRRTLYNKLGSLDP